MNLLKYKADIRDIVKQSCTHEAAEIIEAPSYT